METSYSSDAGLKALDTASWKLCQSDLSPCDVPVCLTWAPPDVGCEVTPRLTGSLATVKAEDGSSRLEAVGFTPFPDASFIHLCSVAS